MKTIISILIIFFSSVLFSQQKKVTTIDKIYQDSENPKYQKWQSLSYFRGYNVLNEHPKSLDDFLFLRSCGANIAHIGSFGWNEREAPYEEIPENIAETDMLVSFCREAGLYYVLAVRQGPGRTDVYKETNNLGPISTIWTNNTEQQLYGNMLKNMVQRYAGDPYFVGINMIIEPNPLWFNFFCLVTPEILLSCLQQSGINMNELYSLMISKVREADPLLPVIVENVQYSTPNYWKIFEPIEEPYVIYDVHSYVPRDYIYESNPNTMEYPDYYFNYPYPEYVWHDKNFIKNTVYQWVQNVQNQTGAPVLLGEFGLLHPQINGPQFLKDIADICIEKGWHFALWNYRPGGDDWNYETMGSDYWNAVLYMLNSGNNADLFLYNITVNQGQNFNYYASNSITARNFIINNGGTVIFTAPNIYLKDGFNALEGSNFTTSFGQVYKKPSKTMSSKSVKNEQMNLNLEKIPDRFFINQNYPNPFNPSTIIEYGLKYSIGVKITIYDILGRVIKTLVNEYQEAGYKSVYWDGTNDNNNSVATGVYIYKIEVGDFADSKKMLLIH